MTIAAPPLTSTQRGRAAIAGIVCTILFDLGLSGFAVAVIFVTIGLFLGLVGILLSGEQSYVDNQPDVVKVISTATGIPRGDVGWVALGACVVGAILIVVSIIASIQILRRGGFARARGITWAGLAISKAASWIFGGIVSGATGAVAGLALKGSSSSGTITTLVVTFVVSEVVGLVIAWLAWWWMAHVMRNRVAPLPTSAGLVPATP